MSLLRLLIPALVSEHEVPICQECILEPEGFSKARVSALGVLGPEETYANVGSIRSGTIVDTQRPALRQQRYVGS